jgi:hypothetical protein
MSIAQVAQYVSELTARVRNDGFRFVFSRLLQVARDRVVPPWVLLYWIPVAEAPEFSRHGTAGSQNEGFRGVLSRLLEKVELRVVTRLDELSPNELRALEQSVGASAIPVFEQRLLQGMTLHLLLAGERVAGTIFFVFGRSQRFQHVVLTERDAMGLDGRIDPGFRGRGLYPVFLLLSIARLKESGVDRLFVDTTEDNDHAIRSFSSVGFRFLIRYRLKRGRYRFDGKSF